MDTGTATPPSPLVFEARPPARIGRVLAARGVRAFGDGYVSLLLPMYLLERGFSALEVGALATATLLGSGLLTLLVGLHAHRYAPRSLLLAAARLMAATGLAFASVHDFWPLLVVAVVGTLNPSSGDVSVFLPLEHALISNAAGDAERTAVFARYSLTGSLLAATGALAAGLPVLAREALGVDLLAAMQAMFVLYALLGAVNAAIYRALPNPNQVANQVGNLVEKVRRAPLRESKRRVYMLAALFSVDAFAGGLVVQSMVALWLYQRFGLSLAATGTIFFWTGLLTAVSYLVAVRVAKRIGLVNTMVFTHLPANLCLVLIPFVPHLSWALALLFVRAALSQMDVPTRSSYVMAIVTPAERPAAASVTSVPRSLASAASPVLAGWMLGLSAFGWPLVAAGILKSLYDLMLLFMFRHVRPPEEARDSTQGGKP